MPYSRINFIINILLLFVIMKKIISIPLKISFELVLENEYEMS